MRCRRYDVVFFLIIFVSTISAFAPAIAPATHKRLYSLNTPPPAPPPPPSTLVSAQPPLQQKLFFVGTFATLATTTALLRPLVHALPSLPLSSYWWHPELLGPIFVAAGAAHFAVDDFLDIVPPKGAWGGLWQLPGSAKLHVYWTGVAEILGGLGLLLSRPVLHSEQLFSISAAALLALSVAVYPANVYMYTHDVSFPRGVSMDKEGHLGRFAMQVVLCGVLAGLI